MYIHLLAGPYPLSPALIDARNAALSEAGLDPSDDPAVLELDGRYPLVSPRDLKWLISVGTGVLVTADGGAVASAGAPLAKPRGERKPISRDRAIAVEDGWSAALAERAISRIRCRELCRAGVRIVDPDRTWIEPGVVVEAGAVIWPDTVLRGTTRIAARAEVRSGCWLTDTQVHGGAVVEPYSVCDRAEIGPGAHVGPMAHLRPGARLAVGARVGNFVEVKNAVLQARAKASHLTYLGDAEIGEDANIGAGTITCNYDGFAKHRTSIGPGAFIGSNSALVAPVSIGAGAIVGAGSVITQDVPPDALAVERSEQRVLADKAPVVRARNQRRARAGSEEKSG